MDKELIEALSATDAAKDNGLVEWELNELAQAAVAIFERRIEEMRAALEDRKLFLQALADYTLRCEPDEVGGDLAAYYKSVLAQFKQAAQRKLREDAFARSALNKESQR